MSKCPDQFHVLCVVTALLAVFSPLPAGAQASQNDDPVARAMAAQALAAANAPSITKTTIVATDIPGTPTVANSAGTLGDAYIQVNGTDPLDTGYLAFKYGADGKGISNYWAKTRGVKMNAYDAVQIGDRIVTDYWQAGTGGQTGHAGFMRIIVDSSAFTAGEVGSRWMVATGTGIASPQVSKQYPNRFGSLNAIVANSFQQVILPGGLGTALPPPGANFGGWLVIGAGAATPGYGPLKFLTSGAQLLTAPEAGAFEVDATAKPYFTANDGVRRAFVLADTTPPGVKTLAGAGTGATASIDANGSSGVIKLTTGANAAAGDVFTVTYAHPYEAASYPVVSAGNASAVALVKNGYLTATATSFTFSVPSGLSASTSYVITFYAPGK